MRFIEIVPFSEELAPYFASLNYEWIEKYFSIEPSDRILLDNPRQNIIDKSGYIFFAKKNDQVIGTLALLKRGEGVYELAKMGISPVFRGHGIGNKLLAHCLNFCKEKGFEKIIIYSARKLKPALHLYQKYGFKEVELEKGDYNRTDIKMIKEL